MIFGNIQNLKEYFFLEDGVLECFNYMKGHALNEYKKGVYEIDGKRLFVNIVEYETVEAEKRFWEAHRNYLDIHLMLEGTEQIDMNFIHNMDVKPYAAEDDFLYDEISSGLLVNKIRSTRRELLESLDLYYRVFVKHEDISALLTEEDL